MKQEKHTPGPWGYVDDGFSSRIQDSNDDAVIYGGRDGDLIGKISDLTLAATAPLLLSELEKQSAWLKHIRHRVANIVPFSVLTGIDQSIKCIDEAIAKAEGRTP